MKLVRCKRRLILILLLVETPQLQFMAFIMMLLVFANYEVKCTVIH